MYKFDYSTGVEIGNYHGFYFFKGFQNLINSID